MEVKPESKIAIKTIVNLDGTISPEKKALIFKAMDDPVSEKKLRMGTRKEAMEILGISRATMGRWIKKGRITPVYLSPSKVQFDLNEIEWYAEHGGHFGP